MPEPFVDDDIEYLIPELEEDFDIVEGQTFKGHVDSINDIIKITNDEFISCDDKA